MKHDVVIIGAGPAGATAARFLSKEGYNVLLLDKEKFPRYKACAGGLCKHIEEFDYLNIEKLDLVKSVCRASLTFSPSAKYEMSYESKDVLFYNVDRKEFDDYLVGIAINAGSDFRDGVKVKEISVRKEYALLRLGDEKEIKSRALIGAGGANDVANKFLRKREGIKRWKLAFSLVEDFEVGESFVSDVYGEKSKCIILLRFAGLHGYAWVFPKRSSLNIGYAGYLEEMRRRNAKELLNQFLKFLKKRNFLPSSVESKKARGAFIPCRGFLRRTYTDRLLLCGDSAGFVSPLSGEGIYYAMDSGRIASKVLCKALEEEKLDEKSLKNYQKIWMERWGKDFLYLKIFHHALMKFTEGIIKRGVENKNLRGLYVGVFNGSLKAREVKWKILREFLIPKEASKIG